MLDILNRWSRVVAFHSETADTLGAAVLEALKTGANLGDAYLRDADLTDADLRGADLTDADLRGADLRGAYLGGAYLGGANLGDAYLRGAYLRGAYLRGADLGDAYLRGAYLRGAYLRGADLRGAGLRGANLRGANLGDADLRGANLGGANLTPIRDDFWAVLCSSPAEVPALRQALIDGRVDGSTYHGTCACLVGTIANARHCDPGSIPGLSPNSSRPAERFFLAIDKGDTPENSESCRIALGWTDEFLGKMRAAFGGEAK